jgi:hypothetical protein
VRACRIMREQQPHHPLGSSAPIPPVALGWCERLFVQAEIGAMRCTPSRLICHATGTGRRVLLLSMSCSLLLLAGCGASAVKSAAASSPSVSLSGTPTPPALTPTAHLTPSTWTLTRLIVDGREQPLVPGHAPTLHFDPFDGQYTAFMARVAVTVTAAPTHLPGIRSTSTAYPTRRCRQSCPYCRHVQLLKVAALGRRDRSDAWRAAAR